MSYVLEVQLRIKPENVDKFMAACMENARAARQEPGCRTFEVVVDPQDGTDPDAATMREAAAGEGEGKVPGSTTGRTARPSARRTSTACSTVREPEACCTCTGGWRPRAAPPAARHLNPRGIHPNPVPQRLMQRYSAVRPLLLLLAITWAAPAQAQDADAKEKVYGRGRLNCSRCPPEWRRLPPPVPHRSRQRAGGCATSRPTSLARSTRFATGSRSTSAARSTTSPSAGSPRSRSGCSSSTCACRG